MVWIYMDDMDLHGRLSFLSKKDFFSADHHITTVWFVWSHMYENRLTGVFLLNKYNSALHSVFLTEELIAFS